MTLVEALYATTRVDQLLLAGEKWVTLVAQLNADVFALCAASGKCVAT